MDALVEIVQSITAFVMDIIGRLWNYFLDLNLFEKLIVLTILPAFLAVAFPVAKYPIFETYFEINNPLAVHLLGLMLAMFLTPFLPAVISLLVREILCVLYFSASLYIHLSGTLSHAPYSLAAGYYINCMVPVLFAVFALLSFFHER